MVFLIFNQLVYKSVKLQKYSVNNEHFVHKNIKMFISCFFYLYIFSNNMSINLQ